MIGGETHNPLRYRSQANDNVVSAALKLATSLRASGGAGVEASDYQKILIEFAEAIIDQIEVKLHSEIIPVTPTSL